MPRKGKPVQVPPFAPATVQTQQDLLTEQIIDALDYLRVQMREGGMPACADLLDDAFARCLDVYVTAKHEQSKDGTKQQTNGTDESTN